MKTLKTLFICICYLLKKERDFTKKALVRDLYIYTHFDVLRYAFKLQEFCENAFKNEECVNLLMGVCEEKHFEPELMFAYLVQKKLENDAKNGNVQACKYIKCHKAFGKNFIKFAKETANVYEKLSELNV